MWIIYGILIMAGFVGIILLIRWILYKRCLQYFKRLMIERGQTGAPEFPNTLVQARAFSDVSGEEGVLMFFDNGFLVMPGNGIWSSHHIVLSKPDNTIRKAYVDGVIQTVEMKDDHLFLQLYPNEYRKDPWAKVAHKDKHQLSRIQQQLNKQLNAITVL